ncbi:GTP cyclohydrolase FolE2 [Acidihalobacter ferrooxydans]|uniref:GTP cyclohydrolase FolE2 n=1 Tax=Acidihalobacter ferrooxydans TaxID=1765967 RepID=A0A1P8UJE0_9GAMM|nr:GTP cyclohydrolase FolE2 [Acidihalobacter ferrooxydans]APZ43901.1 GTP cyclohydrolase [Acidihalobacter ferrooxydans]
MNQNRSAADFAADIPDVQSSPDERHVAINRVGIKSLRHPLRILSRDGSVQATVASADMYVNLPADRKGTHMSRFVALLNEIAHPLDIPAFETLLIDMNQRLGAEEGHIELRFPFFVRKTAPVSGVESLMDYDASLIGELRNGEVRISLHVVVPVTSLCPCSRDISEYGAHNQRSHITLRARINQPMWFEDLIDTAEEAGSCELFGLLKRPDEKFVTERAYENPKFVEDAVRDLAVRLNTESRIDAYVIECENFESIHNHSAYACIERDKTR